MPAVDTYTQAFVDDVQEFVAGATKTQKGSAIAQANLLVSSKEKVGVKHRKPFTTVPENTQKAPAEIARKVEEAIETMSKTCGQAFALALQLQWAEGKESNEPTYFVTLPTPPKGTQDHIRPAKFDGDVAKQLYDLKTVIGRNEIALLGYLLSNVHQQEKKPLTRDALVQLIGLAEEYLDDKVLKPLINEIRASYRIEGRSRTGLTIERAA